MDLALKYIRPAPVASYRVTGPYRTSVPQAWKMMRAWVRRRGLRCQVRYAYGFSLDDPAATDTGDIRYCACVSIGPDPMPDPDQGIFRLHVPGGVYITHPYAGDYSNVGRVFSEIRRQWLDHNDLALDPRRPFLEIYDTDGSDSYYDGFPAKLCVPVLSCSGRPLKPEVSS